MSILSDLITQQGRIATQEGSLSDDQLEVLEAALAGEEAEEVSAGTTVSESSVAEEPVKIHISRKYTLYGLLVGIVVGIVLIVLYYFCRGTLNIAQEMQSTFCIPVFGQVNVKKPRNPLVRGWRRVTSKKKALPLETEQRIALANLRTYCKKNQISRILLTGTQWDLSENAWLQEVRAALQSDQIEMEIVGGLPDSPEALETMNDYSCIALVETLHKSVYKDVVREAELCAEHQVQVVGAIVLN